MTPRAPSKSKFWTGWIITVLVSLLLLFGAVSLLLGAKFVMATLPHFGIPENAALFIGTAELLCAVLYLIPQTTVLGAVLLTGYLGGAVLTHLRVGEPVFFPILLGAIVWISVLLREDRLLALFPVRRVRGL